MLKEIIKKIMASSPLLLRQVARVGGDLPRVFVYHRFAPKGRWMPNRLEANIFRWQLEQMSRHYTVLSFRDCLEHFYANNRWPRRSIVITVDDGYRDFFQYGYPELLRLGLPATFFITTNFINRKTWLWPDRVEYVLNHTSRSRIYVRNDENNWWFDLNGEQDRYKAWKAIIDCCVKLSDTEKQLFLQSLEINAEVNLPYLPPEEYSACQWNELEEMAKNRIEIGSHTLSHPILSRIDYQALEREVKVSKQQIEEKLGFPIFTFCYPNSGPGDINEQVLRAVSAAGYLGAPFGTDLLQWDPFRVPRMGVGPDKLDFLWKLHGGENLGQRLA